MKFAEVTAWVEEHPTESIVIGAGGLIAILWLLGFFSSSSSSASSGSSNLASAYYAAEAQQAVVGGQIQVATIQSAAQTAQTAAQANAAVAINKAQTKAATTINGQNASTQTALGNDDLLAAYSNNAATIATTQSNNDAATAIAQSNASAGIFQTIFGTLMPAELANSANPGYASLNLGSFGNFSGVATLPSVNDLLASGMSQAQINRTTGIGAS
jgi:hypothetical protein